MPIAAKFSKTLYDRLGHPAADELVDWFNQMDESYRADLRALNESNFARFDAKLEQRLSEFGLTIERQVSRLALDLKDQQLIQTRWILGVLVALVASVVGLWFRR